MWFDFGIGEKKKPVVRIFDSSVVSSDDVDVLDLREVAFQARPGGVVKAVKPAPDTIESLINRLIELGEPKPEVVINGEKRADGRESYTATVDGKLLEWVRDDTWKSQSVVRDFALIEKAVICALETRIASVVTKTTTITY